MPKKAIPVPEVEATHTVRSVNEVAKLIARTVQKKLDNPTTMMKKKRELSDEQRAALSERLKRAREVRMANLAKKKAESSSV